ncbi:sensor histidine kinase [Nocardia sp. NPDC101769]|uniref:sensor histidine kinase n=1 Tax=Nocardia sp. NPDC101769 TaxID=3364333 RepID=UPI0038142E29
MQDDPRVDQWQLWVLYVLSGCGVADSIVFLLDDNFPGHPTAAIATISIIPVWAVGLGRRVSKGHLRRFNRFDGREILFVAGLFALLTIAVSFSVSAVSAEPVIYPLLFMSMPLTLSLPASVGLGVVPLAVILTAGGVPTGYMSLAISITLISLLLGPLVGIAMVRAAVLAERQRELLRELADSRAETARLSHEAGIFAERERLAREIHDTLAQGFVSVITLAGAIESEFATRPELALRHLELVRATARENLAEARAMVAELTPTALNGRPLLDAITRLAEQMERQSGLALRILGGNSLPELDPLREVALFRAVQEALTNARKHARCTTITVTLTQLDEGILAEIADDGIGFDPDLVEAGFGLHGMRDRIESVGGMVAVLSSPGSGTTVRIGVVCDSNTAG